MSEMVFESAQALAVIEYARRKRGDEAEYLWAKAPKNAILRRQDSGKWYAAILTVERRKLGGVPKKTRLDDGADVLAALDGTETVEILNLKEDPEEIRYLVDGAALFSGVSYEQAALVYARFGRFALERGNFRTARRELGGSRSRE